MFAALAYAIRSTYRSLRVPLERSGIWLSASAVALSLAAPLGALPAVWQEEAPRRYDVDEEFAQGIVRDIGEGGRMLLVELRDDHELIGGTDPIVSDPSIFRDPTSSALHADDRRDGRLRRFDLSRATGWAFIDDLEGGAPEVVELEQMYARFRVGQVVEIGASWNTDATVTVVDSFGSGGGRSPDPHDLRGATTAGQGRVDTVRVDGRVQVRVNRAFE